MAAFYYIVFVSPHNYFEGIKNIRFKYPVYRHPTHDRFYYMLFAPPIIILVATKKMITSCTNHTLIAVLVCPISRVRIYAQWSIYGLWATTRRSFQPNIGKPSLISLFHCRVQRCQPVMVPARSHTTHMLNRAGVVLVGDCGGHSRRRDTAASHSTSRNHMHA